MSDATIEEPGDGSEEVPTDLLLLAVELDLAGQTPADLAEWAAATEEA